MHRVAKVVGVVSGALYLVVVAFDSIHRFKVDLFFSQDASDR